MFLEVDLDNIKEGMVLAKPVLNKVGQVMIAQDIAITNKHINILKMWGVNKVEIMTNNIVEAASDEYESVSKKKQKLREQLGWDVDVIFLDEIIELGALSKYNVN